MPIGRKMDTLFHETTYNPFGKTHGIEASYLKEVGRIPPLTHERKLELARKIRVGERRVQNLTTRCLRKCRSGDHQHFDVKFLREVMPFLERMAENDGAGWRNSFTKLKQVEAELKRARDEMVESNLRLVITIARAYVNRGLPFSDLIQEGNMGLIKSVSRYDYTKGFRFSTYASWWIRQAILRAISEKSRTIRIPDYVVKLDHKMKGIIHEMFKETHRDPDEDEIAGRMEVPVGKVTEIMDVPWDRISLQTTVDDRGRTLEELLVDKEVTVPFERLIQGMDLAHLTEEVLRNLTPREREIVRSRFGIGRDSAQTLEEIGRKFGISKERVRQVEKKALRKAKWHLRAFIGDLKR